MATEGSPRTDISTDGDTDEKSRRVMYYCTFISHDSGPIILGVYAQAFIFDIQNSFYDMHFEMQAWITFVLELMKIRSLSFP